MKKLKIIILLLLMIPSFVLAGEDEKTKNDKKESNAILACSYNVSTTHGTHKIEIRYYNDSNNKFYQKWTIKYIEAGGKKKTKGPDAFNKIFSNSGSPNVYMPDSVYKSLQNIEIINGEEVFSCPKNGYLDTDYWNEFCFDNNGKWCSDTFGGEGLSGTAFGDNDSQHIDTEKSYDIVEDVEQQIIQNTTNGITEEIIYSGDEEAITEIINDNQTAVKNDVYRIDEGGADLQGINAAISVDQEEIVQEQTNLMLDVVENMKEELQEDYNEGFIDEATYQERLEILNGYTDESVNELFNRVFVDNFVVNVVILDQNCTSLLGDPNPEPGEAKTPAYYLVVVFSVMKYIAIIILVVLSITDFVSAISSHDNDSLKKAVNKTITRAILCVVIFILPTLIEFVLQYINESAEGLCGIK